MRTLFLVLLLCVIVAGQRSCYTTDNHCEDCLRFPGCRWCPDTDRCYPIDDVNSAPCNDWKEKQGTCASQQCSWYKVALNPSVCDTKYIWVLSISLLTIVVTAAFIPLLQNLRKAPWSGTVDGTSICPFTHEAVDGSNVCTRCGTEVKELKPLKNDYMVCVGCQVYVSSTAILGTCASLAALGLSVFFIGWGPAMFGLVVDICVWVVLFPFLAYKLRNPNVRRYLFGASRDGAMRALLGAQMVEEDMPPDQAAVMRPLPSKFKKAIIADLRAEEEVMAAWRPTPWQCIKNDYDLQSRICLLMATEGPCLAAAVCAWALYDNGASAVLFLFLGILAFSVTFPPIASSIISHNCVYVLTSKRGLTARRGVLGGFVLNSTDFRVMTELLAFTDRSGQGGMILWKNEFFPGFLYVPSVADTEEKLVEAARRAHEETLSRIEGHDNDIDDGAFEEDLQLHERTGSSDEGVDMKGVELQVAGDGDDAPAGAAPSSRSTPAGGAAAPVPPASSPDTEAPGQWRDDRLHVWTTYVNCLTVVMLLPLIGAVAIGIATALSATPLVFLVFLGPFLVMCTLVLVNMRVYYSKMLKGLQDERLHYYDMTTIKQVA